MGFRFAVMTAARVVAIFAVQQYFNQKSHRDRGFCVSSFPYGNYPCYSVSYWKEL
jgi:hypothetical protein